MERNHIKTVISEIKRNRCIIVVVSLILIALSCISPFTPNYQGGADFLVVDGSLIKGYGAQVINISRSASISQPKYYPLENCHVKIVDESGNEFVFTEGSRGKYVANIDDALLNYNTRYKLVFNTPSGENYESGYQKLLQTVPIDSIYSIKENHYSLTDSKYLNGLQFYVDLDAPDDAPRYYRWQIDETWEIHAGYMITGYYDGDTVKFDANSPSDSLYYCWDTKAATGIYTCSTTNLSHNIFKKVPLHFKQDNSLDLTIKYCATVRQYALNEDAYNYWYQKEIELNESGQIYTTQPSQLKSNIYNVNNPGEKVLGFFWASSFTEKHRFEKNPFQSVIGIGPTTCVSYGSCSEFVDDRFLNILYSIAKMTKNFPKPPVYMYNYTVPTGFICVYFSKDECVDCRLMGGTTHKPDFWE
jgi:hypothetical protein